ncbi:MAG: transglutaminase-like domain-containing protein [Candidatus Hydrogenedentes bacterium]|nr:transglutaminase-like domain-containing protein [Candidatus Hydrogenedentota bacterium]
MLWKTARRVVSIFIIAFWVAMMVILLVREGFFSKTTYTFAQQRWDTPIDWQMGIFTPDDNKVGFIQIHTQPELVSPYGPAFKLDLFTKLDTVVFSTPVSLIVQGFAWFSQRNGLENFNISLRSGDTRFSISGDYDGKSISGKVLTGKESIPYNIPVGRNALLTGGPGLPLLDTPALQPGESISLNVFDPLSMSTQKAVITSHSKEVLILGEEKIETYKMTITLGGLTTTVWVTPTQEIVQAELPIGIKLRKISLAEALASRGEESQSQGNLIASTAIKPRGKTPFRGAKQMWVKIDGIPESAMPPVGLYQTRTAEGYFISPPTNIKSTLLTERVLRNIPPQSLSSSPLIPVEHPKIKQLAEEIVGDETDPWVKSKKIFDWVYKNIKKQPSFNLPSALAVLESRYGDCNEHAVLFTALARAVGIPTQICIGLVWSGELEAFGYHAWVEVFCGDWIPMDPTLGQEIADATHIKLIEGNIEQWTRLALYINQVQVEVISIE